jgi:hypothetical protein
MNLRQTLGRVVTYKVINGDSTYQSAYSANTPAWTAKTALKWAKATADHHLVRGRVIAISLDGDEKVVYTNRYIERGRKKES